MLRTWLSGVSKKGLQDFWGLTETSESQVGSWPEAEKATGKPSAPDAGATYLPVIYSEIRWTDRWTQVSSKAPKVLGGGYMCNHSTIFPTSFCIYKFAK